MPAQLLSDGAVTFVGGQDASKSPQDVPPGAYYTGVNVSTEKGVLKPRWGLFKHTLKFPSGGVAQANTMIKSFRDLFGNGKFQALAPYSIGSDYFIVVVICGQIFFINKKTKKVEHIPLEGEQINPRASRVNWTPAGKYLILFDFPNFPVIIDGVTARRADPEKDEIPVSNIGGYNQNRLFVGNAGNEFTAGDPVGSQATPDAPITFLEYFTPGSDFFQQAFQLNTNYNNDPITAFGFLQAVDSSTGIGPLLVATRSAIYAYLSQNPRDTWEAGQFGSNILYGAGIAGPRAIANLNSDVIFFSAEGQARSLSMSRQEQGKWSHTPISKEVHNWLKLNDKSLQQYSFVTYFKNKVFLSANPYRTICKGINNERLFDYANGGLVVLELDNISTLTKEDSVAWAGLWTGVRPMDMVVCDDSLFVISKDDGGVNELYEFTPGTYYDTDGKSVRYIKSKLQTAEHAFESPFNDKFLHSIDVSLHDVKGDFKMKVRYRPDQYTQYQDWNTFQYVAPWRSCRKPFYFNGLAGHSFLNVNLGSPPKVGCSGSTGQRLTTFRRIQLEFTLEGIYWELRGYRVKALVNSQNENRTLCGQDALVPLPLECPDDWETGEFSLCQRQS